MLIKHSYTVQQVAAATGIRSADTAELQSPGHSMLMKRGQCKNGTYMAYIYDTWVNTIHMLFVLAARRVLSLRLNKCMYQFAISPLNGLAEPRLSTCWKYWILEITRAQHNGNCTIYPWCAGIMLKTRQSGSTTLSTKQSWRQEDTSSSFCTVPSGSVRRIVLE